MQRARGENFLSLPIREEVDIDVIRKAALG